MQQFSLRTLLVVMMVALGGVMLSGCADTYYGAMEKVGIHKRDIMVDRVEDARDAQEDAQEQFQSALEQFNSVVQLEDTDLKRAYDDLKSEYDASVEAAENVSDRIDKVESVAQALFEEWEEELQLYENLEFKRSSQTKLNSTRVRYKEMLTSMHRAEQSMVPVLRIFQDNVLYLKHNLNAQAIGSLRGEFSSLQQEINRLVIRMNQAIDQSNQFIADIQ